MSEDELIPPDTEAEAISLASSPEPEPAVTAAEAEPASLPEFPKDAPMLDVHPPHEPIHTWKGYLLHMSTIVLGLLIAIGLEQSVEAIHRARERQELRESLRRDAEKAVVDAQSSENTEKPPLIWLSARQQQVKDALATHRPLAGPLPRAPHVSSNLPIDPAWGAAKASGQLPLLTQQEVQVYSEADRLFAAAQQSYSQGVAASRARGSFEYRYADPKNMGVMDLSALTPADLNHYLDLLIDEDNAWDQHRVLCEYVRGGETAILAGERDLGRVQKAELQFYTRAVR